MYTPRSPFVVKLEQQDARMTWQKGLLFSAVLLLAYLAINGLVYSFDRSSNPTKLIVIGLMAAVAVAIFLRRQAKKSGLPVIQYLLWLMSGNSNFHW